jgi:large subunit ribosomal protein L31
LNNVNAFAAPSRLVTERVPLTQHPTMHLIDVRCSSCGASFSTHSARETIAVDVCSSCHPAYTGSARAVVAGDRIEQFNRRRALAVT